MHRFPLMIVDEFQDTTDVQWKTVKILIEKGIHFLGVGDPYQTLFSFAGASYSRFDQLKSMRHCQTFQLTINHRLTKQILALSNSIRSQIKESIVAIKSNKNGPKPQVILHRERGCLIEGILEKIGQHMEGVSLNDMAVLYRFGSDAQKLKRKLKLEKIPYRTFSSETSDHVKFATAIIQISRNQGTKAHWKQILPLLSGVGEQKVKTILEKLKNKSFGDINIKTNTDLSKLKDLISYIPNKSPWTALDAIYKFYVGLKKTTALHPNDPAIEDLYNIARKSKALDEFILKINDKSYGVYHPMNRDNPRKEYLTLSTIHKSKGKEFKVVFVLGSYDLLFKSLDIFKDSDAVRDEMMVMDTAVTRCSRHLYLMFLQSKEEWCSKSRKENPSIFIRNCPPHLYETYTIKKDTE